MKELNILSDDFYDKLNKQLADELSKLDAMAEKTEEMRTEMAVIKLDTARMIDPRYIQSLLTLPDAEQDDQDIKRFLDMAKELADIPPLDISSLIADIPPLMADIPPLTDATEKVDNK